MYSDSNLTGLFLILQLRNTWHGKQWLGTIHVTNHYLANDDHHWSHELLWSFNQFFKHFSKKIFLLVSESLGILPQILRDVRYATEALPLFNYFVNAYSQMKSMFMNDMHQRSYLLSFEISWLIGFCNQWALLYLSVIFQYFSEWGFNMWFKIYWNTFFAKCSCVVIVSDTSPYIVCYEESEILCLPGQ